ncbi:DUF1127 domain-containing protein [Plastorhodobacter daqingensis]|uniref:DUF1127 domain-containing protein n=1 Tax=Plastorhodobacter daqingensis TaxID=1387281 RepID=A0ABW2UNZ0_9RHOB
MGFAKIIHFHNEHDSAKTINNIDTQTPRNQVNTMTTAPSLARPAALAPSRRWNTLALLSQWRELRRQRLRLADLDDAALRDIGITREEASREARRPAWDAPQHWLR